MDPRRSRLRKLTGRRSPAAFTVPTDLASEASSLKKRLGKVNTSPEDGFWRLDFAGAPHGDLCHAQRKSALIGKCSCTCSSTFLRDKAHRRLSGAHQHWSPSHSQWLVVSAGAPRLGIAQRALRKPRAFGVIWPRSGRTRGGARFTASSSSLVTNCRSCVTATRNNSPVTNVSRGWQNSQPN